VTEHRNQPLPRLPQDRPHIAVRPTTRGLHCYDLVTVQASRCGSILNKSAESTQVRPWMAMSLFLPPIFEVAPNGSPEKQVLGSIRDLSKPCAIHPPVYERSICINLPCMPCYRMQKGLSPSTRCSEWRSFSSEFNQS
jgi:hypothetical protein